MRWPTKRYPSDGEVREVVRFAWLPVELESGETVWLEKYIAREMWDFYVDCRFRYWKIIQYLPMNKDGGAK